MQTVMAKHVSNYFLICFGKMTFRKDVPLKIWKTKAIKKTGILFSMVDKSQRSHEYYIGNKGLKSRKGVLFSKFRPVFLNLLDKKS
jgi:hypothetical protein